MCVETILFVNFHSFFFFLFDTISWALFYIVTIDLSCSFKNYWKLLQSIDVLLFTSIFFFLVDIWVIGLFFSLSFKKIVVITSNASLHIFVPVHFRNMKTRGGNIFRSQQVQVLLFGGEKIKIRQRNMTLSGLYIVLWFGHVCNPDLFTPESSVYWNINISDYF